MNSLLAEANLMKRLDHPALPRIVDIIENGVTIYVVMDYIEGESLDKILLEHGPQPEKAVINWAMQICDALNYLRSRRSLWWAGRSSCVTHWDISTPKSRRLSTAI